MIEETVEEMRERGRKRNRNEREERRTGIKSRTSLILACFRLLARVCLFVLRFYSPVNPMGSCRAQSVYLATRLLGRLSPLSG